MKTSELQTTEANALPAPTRVGSSEFVRRHCGSSWRGFWKRPNRGMVWLEVATAARNTHNGYIAAANILNTPESAAAMRKLRRMCGWALERAKKYGVDWRDFPQGQSPDCPRAGVTNATSETECGRAHPRATLPPNDRA